MNYQSVSVQQNLALASAAYKQRDGKTLYRNYDRDHRSLSEEDSSRVRLRWRTKPI